VVWKTVARSAIGTRHQEQQFPCQDFSAVGARDGIVMGAIADGAGSAAHAEVGAKLAVKTVLRYLVATEEWLRKRQGSWRSLPHPPTEDLVRKLFTKAVEQVGTVLQIQAEKGGYPVDQLACTLLAFLATPNWVAALQIGDGFIVVQTQGNYQLLFQPDKGEYVNQTTFVTSRNALRDAQIRVLPAPVKFICAASDALENVAIRLSDYAPFPPFFQPLQEFMQEASDPNQEDEYLVHFLESERLNRKTDDDKTLLLCLWTEGHL
jgi:serine/threonine protein phosphatase PrpC